MRCVTETIRTSFFLYSAVSAFCIFDDFVAVPGAFVVVTAVMFWYSLPFVVVVVVVSVTAFRWNFCLFLVAFGACSFFFDFMS